MIRNVFTVADLNIALAAATAGDTIVLASGSYDMGTTAIALPNGVNLFGVETFSSVIRSAVTVGSPEPVQGCMVTPGNGSEIRDLSIVSSLPQTEVHFQSPVGFSAPQSPFTTATLRRVYLSAYSDGIYIHGGSSPAPMRLSMYDSYVSTGFDTTRISTTPGTTAWDLVFDYFNCLCECTHPDWASNDNRTHAVSTGKLRLFGGRHRSIVGSGSGLSAVLFVDNINGVIENYGGALESTNGGSGSLYDADIVTPGVIKIHKNSTYNAGKFNGAVSIIGGEYPAVASAMLHRRRGRINR